MKNFVSWGTHGQTELTSLRRATLNVCGGLFMATIGVLVVVRVAQGRFLQAALELITVIVVGVAIRSANRGGFNIAVLLVALAPPVVGFFLIRLGVYQGIHMMPQIGMSMLTFTLVFSSVAYRAGYIFFCLILMAITAFSVPSQQFQAGVFLVECLCFAFIFICFVTFFERQELNLRRTIQNLKQSNLEKNEANQKLNDRVEELIVFSHIMSHDLKGPLTGIAGYTQLLQMDVRNGVSLEENRESLDAIAASAENMNSIITDLLTYTEVSSGAWSEEKVDLDSVVSQAFDLLAYQIGQNQVSVECSDLPMVPGNFEMLKTVFYNLFSNAIKYQPKNVPGHQATLKVWAEFGEKEVQICIRDNGIGISDEYLPMLFSPFQREHQSTYEGTGLGMPICKSILEKFGGDISVAKTGPDGTTFQLTFPAFESEVS